MKIKILRKLWNMNPSHVCDVEDFRAIWAVKKGYAELIVEKKADQQPYDNKAIGNAPENKTKKAGRPRK